MHTALEIATYLEAQGYGTIGASTGTSIFDGPMGIAPDKAISVRVSGGPSPQYTQETTTPWDEPTRVKVMVRDAASTGYESAESVVNAIARELEIVNHMRLPTSTGTLYGRVKPTSPAIPLRVDERERQIFVVNFEINKEPSL